MRGRKRLSGATCAFLRETARVAVTYFCILHHRRKRLVERDNWGRYMWSFYVFSCGRPCRLAWEGVEGHTHMRLYASVFLFTSGLTKRWEKRVVLRCTLWNGCSTFLLYDLNMPKGITEHRFRILLLCMCAFFFFHSSVLFRSISAPLFPASQAHCVFRQPLLFLF